LGDAELLPAELHRALEVACTPHRGPVFCDVPIDVIFSHAEATIPEADMPRGDDPDPDEVARAAALLAGAERPVIVAGSDVWWDGAWDALRRCAEELRVPVYANGLGRGCIPADHELAFSRTRSRATKQADVVCVIGTPLDFRLAYGSFGEAAVIHVADHPDGLARHVKLAARPAGDLTTILEAMTATSAARADHEPWIDLLRHEEAERRAADDADLAADTTPVHPARVYGELVPRLDRDAVVINDGGDFVSFAGRFVDSYEPGCWLDPGPFGCLGTGLGYAIAARVVHPDRQVVALLGDGAFGLSGFDVDTLVRHDLPVVMVVGNNGIWALEKHPMQMICGYDAACDLQPELGYDRVVEALGGAGETVDRPEDLGPALDRAFAAGVPYLVNVITDPEVAYPRTSNLI
jgi:acetolactate synthase-1/2/3 large subunit